MLAPPGLSNLQPAELLRAQGTFANPGAGVSTREQARQAAQDFESVFIAQMMEPMFQGLKTDGMFGGGQGEQVFRSLMIQEAGKDIARSGGIGIADQVYREILRMKGIE
jgi:peptidoglycan hydrolase FlgJ